MNTLEQQVDRAVEIARDRDWEAHHGGEAEKPTPKVIDFEAFADAPYEYISPIDDEARPFFDALGELLSSVETAEMCKQNRTVTSEITMTARLARLGAEVLKIAQSRGLRHNIDKIVQDVPQ